MAKLNSGDKVGRLVLLRSTLVHKPRTYGFKCMCECGELVTVTASSLTKIRKNKPTGHRGCPLSKTTRRKSTK